MKKYMNPKVELLVLNSEDVITVSVLEGYADQNDIARLDIGSMF